MLAGGFYIGIVTQGAPQAAAGVPEVPSLRPESGEKFLSGFIGGFMRDRCYSGHKIWLKILENLRLDISMYSYRM